MRTFVALLLGSAVVLAPAGSARAEAGLSRPKSIIPIGIGFEFKGGPYLPALAESTSSPGGDAFTRIYRNPSPRPLFAFGVDLQLYRGFGTAGVGGSFGFMQFVGKALLTTAGPTSSDTTVFNQLPLNVEAFYRLDWLAERTWFPLVPYARGGPTYHVWWTTNGIGDVSRYSPNAAKASTDAVGRGGRFGVTGTIGLALLLNSLDPGSALNLFNATSIRGTYIFAELQTSRVNNFGRAGFDLSDNTWNVGIYFEM